MGKYTMELRTICEVEKGLDESVGWNDVNDIVTNESVRRAIFGTYPMFTDGTELDDYRAILEPKILKHFYTREIGVETVGLFKMRLNNKMNEIMPYYNKLYESELLEFDPFEDTNIKTERGKEGSRIENEDRLMNENESNTGTNRSKTNGSSEDWDLFSNTPQGQLNNVKEGKYLTTADNQTNNNEESSESNSSNVKGRDVKDNKNRNISDFEDFVEKVKGKKGNKSYPELLEEFRKTFLNIDMMIIEELKGLFFKLW